MSVDELQALRRQAVLNAMFGEVFDPTHLAGIDGDDGLGDGDAALDNLMWSMSLKTLQPPFQASADLF
jgi:hypothetical protein